jgi:hypothetical protein
LTSGQPATIVERVDNDAGEELNVDPELLKDLGFADAEGLDAVEYAQKCVFLYEQTLKAIGLLMPEMISQAVDSAQVTYSNPVEPEGSYAHLPEHY